MIPEDGRVWVGGVGQLELVLFALLADLAPEVGVVREGELDGSDLLPGKVVYEERIWPEEREWLGSERSQRCPGTTRCSS